MAQRTHDTREAFTTQPKAAPTPRRISVEVRKAETRLINFDKKRDELIDRHQDEIKTGEYNRAMFIAGLPSDVRRMLAAGGVITEAEAKDADE